MLDLIDSYFQQLKIDLVLCDFVKSIEVVSSRIRKHDGYVRLKIVLKGDLLLYLFEYVSETGFQIQKSKYSYHLEDTKGLIFRYDNAPHHKEIETSPHHKHLKDGSVVPSKELDLHNVLDEIWDILAVT